MSALKKSGEKKPERKITITKKMNSLALTYAGLVVSDNLIAKALAITEIARMARIETRLREFLIASWERRSKKAIKVAEKMATQLKPASKINAAIEKEMDGWTEEILPIFLIELEKTYNLARIIAWKKATQQTKASLRYPIEERPDSEPIEKAAKGSKKVAQLLPSFDLADERAIESLKNHQVLWIGEHYKEKVSPSIAQTTREVMTESGQSPKVAGKLMRQKVKETLKHVKVPGGFNGTAPQYFEGLTANAATVARVHGKIRSFSEIGITTYRINNPNDKRTCERCSFMDGKEFSTSQGSDQMQRELTATTPEEVKAAHPWLSRSQITKLSSPKALADKGQALPPYHFKCRCTVDIGTSSRTYESLVPLTPPKPGGAPIVPKPAPPTSKPIKPPKPDTSVKRYPATQDGGTNWANSFNEDEARAMDRWTGGGYTGIRRVQSGRIPSELSKWEQDELQKAKKYIKGLDSVFARAPNHKGVVYRGMDLPKGLAEGAFVEGNYIEQSAYSSWSRKKKIAIEFADGAAGSDELWVVMKVDVSKDAHFVGSVSSHAREDEVVMRAGKKLRVKNVEHHKTFLKDDGTPGVRKGNGVVVTLEEVDEIPRLMEMPVKLSRKGNYEQR